MRISDWSSDVCSSDLIEVSDVLRFERELIDYLCRNSTVLDTRRETNVLDDDTAAELEKRVDAFILEFQAGDEQSISAPGTESAEAAEVDDVNQEKIVKGRQIGRAHV